MPLESTTASRARVDPRALVAVLLAAAFVAGQLAVEGLPSFGHDGIFHVLWQGGFREQLAEGVLYPRWLPGMDAGYGSPVFFYYPPLPHYVAALVSFVTGLEAQQALGVAAALAVTLGGVGVLRYLSRYASPLVAASMAVLYMSFEPLLRIDVYQRSAYAEVWAFGLAPFVFVGVDAIFARGARAIWVLSLSTAALLLTHAPSCLVVAPIALAYALAQVRSARHVLHLLAAGLIGLALAAPYLATALGMRDAANFAATVNDHFDFHHWFLFGKDEPGFKGAPTLRLWTRAALGITATAAPALLLAWLARPRAWRVVFFFSSMLYCWWLLTPLSEPVWSAIELLQQLQFPSRFNVLLQFSAVALIGLSLAHARTHTSAAMYTRARWLYLAAAVVWASVAHDAGVRAYARNHDHHLPQRLLHAHHEAPEYALSKGRGRWHVFEGRNEQTRVTEGNADVRVQRWQGRDLALSVKAREPSVITLHQSHFPGWTASSGAGNVEAFATDAGLLALRVPAGTRDVTVQLLPSLAERLGRGAFWLGLVLWLTCLGLALRHRCQSRS